MQILVTYYPGFMLHRIRLSFRTGWNTLPFLHLRSMNEKHRIEAKNEKKLKVTFGISLLIGCAASRRVNIGTGRKSKNKIQAFQ